MLYLLISFQNRSQNMLFFMGHTVAVGWDVGSLYWKCMPVCRQALGKTDSYIVRWNWGMIYLLISFQNRSQNILFFLPHKMLSTRDSFVHASMYHAYMHLNVTFSKTFLKQIFFLLWQYLFKSELNFFILFILLNQPQ